MTSQVIQKVTSTDNAVVRFDGTTGQVQNSAITIDDSGNIGSGAQSFNGFGGSGFKNYVINGGFDVWQRGTSFNAYGYSADRWLFSPGVGAVGIGSKTLSAMEITNLKGPAFKINITTIGTDYAGISQKIENITRFSGKTLTLSFKHSGNLTGSINIYFNYGSGGSTQESIVLTNNIITSESTYTKKQITFTVPDLSTKTIGEGSFLWVIINVDNKVLGNKYFGTFQLEEGSTATPFENRPYGLELSLCQRYYEKIDTTRCNTIVYGTGTGFEGAVKFKTVKRSTPSIALGTASHWRTITIYSGVALSAIGAQEITESGFQIIGTSTGGNITAGYAGRVQVGDGYTDNGLDGIFVSAEL